MQSVPYLEYVEERNLPAVLRGQADLRPDEHALSVLVNGEKVVAKLTYRELSAAVRERASSLMTLGLRGSNVLLVYESGIDFEIDFLACLYAGVVAVPVPVPRRPQALQRLRRIATDATSTMVLTNSATRRRVASDLGAEFQNGLNWVETDTLDSSADDWHYREIAEDDIALLQYTSGSTGDPKGVMVTHGNLWHAASEINEVWPAADGGAVVSWLPMFHDMGLMYGIIFPIVAGIPVYIMSPESFIHRPSRWLEAISRYRATHAIAPNFAYEQCIGQAPMDGRPNLDLSSWLFAASGAEQIRAHTLQRFADKFSPYGLNPNSLVAGYGLAENTLKVSGSPSGRLARTLWLSAKALHEGRAEPAEAGDGAAIPVVGCGWSQGDTKIRIVHPDTSESVPDNVIGEIWVNGSCVAKGYWNKPLESEATFRARIAEDPSDDRYLRTGDLGFRYEGELYITGRRKDMMIFNGENHYPHDIEYSAERSHPNLRPGSCCAFSIEHEGRERLVIAVEVNRSIFSETGRSELIAGIESAIWREHEVPTFTVILVKRGTLPRTTSGKIQRRACRQAYLDGDLTLASASEGPAPKTDELLNWLRDWGRRRVDSRLMDERRCIPPHIVLDLGRKGLLGMQIPAEYGGLGLDNGSTVRVIEQLAAIDLSLATFVCDNNALGVFPVLRHADERLRARMLPELANGRMLAAFAITEPGAGSAMHSISSVAREDSSGQWSITGEKSWSGSSAWSDVIITFVQARDAANRVVGITGFAVPSDSPGLRTGKEALTMGMRAMVQNALHFEEVHVGADAVLGAPGAGLTVANETMMRARLLIGALSLGAMKRSLQLQLRYAQRREISTGRLLDNPVTLEYMTEATAATNAVEALLYGTADLLDSGYPVPDSLFLTSKVLAPELLWEVVDRALQTMGGRGYIETNVLPQILRDARVLRIFEGPTESLRMHLGSTLAIGRSEVPELLSRHCGAEDIAAELTALVPRVLARYEESPAILDPVNRQRAAHNVLGQVAAAAVMTGMVRRQAMRDPVYKHALAWAERQLDGASRQAMADLTGGLDAEVISSAIERYQASIGVVDQQAAGVEDALDLLLRDDYRTVSAPVGEIVAESGPDHLREWLISWVAQRAQISPAEIDTSAAFQRYGLDSIAVANLVGDLFEQRDLTVPSALIWEYPTIDTLCRVVDRLDGAAFST